MSWNRPGVHGEAGAEQSSTSWPWTLQIHLDLLDTQMPLATQSPGNPAWYQ